MVVVPEPRESEGASTEPRSQPNAREGRGRRRTPRQQSQVAHDRYAAHGTRVRMCMHDARTRPGSLFCVSFLEHDRTQHHVARIASPLAPPSMIGDRIARSGTVRPRSQTAERPRGPLCVLTLTP